LNDKTKKKNMSFKENKKKNLGELPKFRIIYKTHNDARPRINKEVQFSINLMLKNENEKKSILKNYKVKK